MGSGERSAPELDPSQLTRIDKHYHGTNPPDFLEARFRITSGLLLDQNFVETQRPVTPGVVVTQTQTAFDDQGQFSVNEQRADAHYFTVDGVSANFGIRGTLPALSAQSGTNSLVSIDVMQEFQVADLFLCTRVWTHARRADSSSFSSFPLFKPSLNSTHRGFPVAISLAVWK
jgi:hypothetical protein